MVQWQAHRFLQISASSLVDAVSKCLTFIIILIFIYLDCVMSSLLHAGFLVVWAGSTLCYARASHHSGSCGAQAPECGQWRWWRCQQGCMAEGSSRHVGFSDQGWNLCLLPGQTDSLPLTIIPYFNGRMQTGQWTCRGAMNNQNNFGQHRKHVKIKS